MVMELKLVPLRLLLFVRFAAPLGKTRFSPPFPVGAAPPSQLPLVFQFGLLAPVQVNVCAAPRGASVSRASNTSRAAMRSRRTPRGGAARRPVCWEQAGTSVLRLTSSNPPSRRAPGPHGQIGRAHV